MRGGGESITCRCGACRRRVASKKHVTFFIGTGYNCPCIREDDAYTTVVDRRKVDQAVACFLCRPAMIRVMHLDQLSKSQIVLLTLLVSFVTSIATGIVTVSLMDQAPPIVAQTVNRVVEHTVETVTPAKSQAAGATVVTQEKTVVIKESDQVAAAVTKLEPSIVRVYSTSAENPLFLGLAIVLREEGVAITDSSTLGGRNDAYLALADGRRVRAFVTERNEV